MNYKIILSREAVKTLDKIDRILEMRIRDAMRLLENEPVKLGKTVKSMKGLCSLRVGGWRILYTISADNNTVCVLAIRPRG
jgi:mRNA-degrading endonuclease RelE of RelBE toxin-antitoxin system